MKHALQDLRSSTHASPHSTSSLSLRRMFSAQATPKAPPQAAAAAAAPKSPPGSPHIVMRTILLGSLAAGGLFAYALFNSKMPEQGALGTGPRPVSSVKPDYGKVRKALEDLMDAPDYDDGSYGPLLVRLAWHAAGTYDQKTLTGGSNGATMRFHPECGHGANAGLGKARDLLEPIKVKFPWISYADLWTLAGVVAIETMGGPVIPWRPGRVDKGDGSACPPDGRLPNATLGASHIRDVFGRMGFNDQEMVALIGAHAVGRCHPDRSGFWGPWNFSPTTFSNLYFVELTKQKWSKKTKHEGYKWTGPPQYEDPSGKLMMLPSDMALLWDGKFKKYVQEYAKDEEKFFNDFAKAFSKLLELGVPFPEKKQAAVA